MAAETLKADVNEILLGYHILGSTWNGFQKESEVNYKDGKLDGKWTWWNKKGQKVRQKNYKNGKLDGKLIEWFQFNGEIKREENYKNGKILF